ncbi:MULTISPECIES: MbnP family copper-binding protein [unclassified Arsukibacterium]|uniref:MbnP family copper-binding protein n=1 Tax=unclassified Arsukibacterium TaxID=2635278 RepID=UPI000C547438|nr:MULTISPECIES: MbnP family copper-binding protein [unclassified Arsukibacterium]MAA93836.1 metallo-mystery pair system four-Cys motif protein [Rheinheimera sp.]MBM34390.1 metallo-mystery pair system four-Cys motif protein [Rheinheimera sp.]HAW92084.1 metallo-mystery pair system four-Cys motif protein [Candidatus Azambacteria bacterium]|tara:strand:- start:1714 stop:2481 length:768 start_codon:yes stop_codon:yes gene_type:complete
MNIAQTIYLSMALVVCSSLMIACNPTANSNNMNIIDINPAWQQHPIECDHAITINNQQWQLQYLRFYLSDVKLDQQPQSLTTTLWQQPDLALLGTDCQGNTNWQLIFAEPLAAGQLSFTLGLPFAVNHQNPLTAKPPLNFSEMFWSWQLGYKFLRLDMQGPNHGWAFHLGSTGCQSASVLRPPALPCRAANTFEVTLDYQPNQKLQLNLAALLSDIELSPQSSCMSDSLQTNCQQLFDNLSLAAPWQLSPASPAP